MKIVCEVDYLEDNEPIIYGPYAQRDRLDYNEFAENEDGKRASDSAPCRMLSPAKRKSERNSRAIAPLSRRYALPGKLPLLEPPFPAGNFSSCAPAERPSEAEFGRLETPLSRLFPEAIRAIRVRGKRSASQPGASARFSFPFRVPHFVTA